MEIIIHGKPNAGSHNSTNGINENFADKIINDFFEQSDKINFGDCLIVDTYYWQGKWYTVYTYFVNKNLVGSDSRNTYFGLSIIVEGHYYCLVSEVYSKLKDIYSTYVTGRYIRNGQYIVQDFSDHALFSGLVNKINEDGYMINLVESIDNKFRQCSDHKFDAQYNLMDCDSKAFVQTLRDNGRVVVSETVKSKDQQLNDIDSLRQELYQMKMMYDKKTEKIKKLESQIDSITNEGSKKDLEKKELNDTIKSLKSKNNELENQLSDSGQNSEELRQKLEQIATIVVSLPNVPSEAHRAAKNKTNFEKNLTKVSFFLLIIAVILLIICTFRSSNIPASSEPSNQTETVFHNKYGNKGNTEFTEGTASETLKDEDCGLSVYLNGKKINSDNSEDIKEDIKIKDGSTICILATKPNPNYKLFISNAKVQTDLEFNKPITINAKNPDEEIIISYGSGNDENVNPKTIIKFKVEH